MRWTEQIAMLLLITILVVGCRPVKPTSGAAPAGYGILIEMWGSKDCVSAGEAVHLRATATNKGTEPFVVDLQDLPVLDIWVTKGPSILQRWSEGKPLASDVTGLALQPGQSKTIEMDWIPATSVDGPVYAGAHYTRRYSWGDDPLIVFILIEVQHCSGFGP